MDDDVLIEKGKLLITAKALSVYLGVSKVTIHSYKTKGLESYKVDGIRSEYFILKEVDTFLKSNVKSKHIPKKDREEEIHDDSDDDIVLVGGKRLHQLDVNDPFDLELLALHPLGEKYIDTLKGAEDIKTKQHTLRVKRGEYLLVDELNIAISEILALIKNTMVTLREQLPITQSEKLIEMKIIVDEDKHIAQRIISNEADRYIEDSLKDIDDSMLKRVPDTLSRAVNFLKKLIEKVEVSHSD